MMLAAMTLTVVTGADSTDIDQCRLLPYADQCIDECGGEHESIQCPLSDRAQDGWSKSVWDSSANAWNNAGSVVENAVNNAGDVMEHAAHNFHDANDAATDYIHNANDNLATAMIHANDYLWGKSAENGVWYYPDAFCGYPCSECAEPCGGNWQNRGSCMTNCAGGAGWTGTTWDVWAKSVGIEDYNGTSTGTWSDEDADVVVPAAAGGDTTVTAASAEESASSSSMGAASSLALLIVATATVATTMMMM